MRKIGIATQERRGEKPKGNRECQSYGVQALTTEVFILSIVRESLKQSEHAVCHRMSQGLDQ